MSDASRADLILSGGAVHTQTSAPPADAVAVRQGAIVAVGPAEDVFQLRGPTTQVVGLEGCALLPGFVDAHVHPVWAGITMSTCDLTGARDATDALRRIGEYASANPDLQWVTGSGWAMSSFERGTPSREALDAVIGDRPAYFTNADGHGAWVNSTAMQVAGLSSLSADPADGRIERGDNGEPQGTLHEGGAKLVSRYLPPVTAEDQLAGLLRGQKYLHSLGITGWQDAIVGSYLGDDTQLPTYLDAAARGLLTARVVGALWWDREAGEEQIDELLALRERAGGQNGVGRFRATSVKVMQDGVAENFTAAMLAPYLDGHGGQTDNRGLSYVNPEMLDRAVTRLDAEGFQVHFHAIGDRAVREVLDSVRAARDDNGPNDNRHHVAHIQVIDPDDLQRFKELGVAANMQALWAAHEPQMDDLTVPFLGDQRAELQYPFADLAALGVLLAAGSDWPVSSPNPLVAAHVAVNRRRPETPEAPPLIPQQRLDVATFLRAYTYGSAWINHAEDQTGSIELGKLADLVVLDADPLAINPMELADVGVLATYVGGELVHASPDFDG
jgi:predicted amidohydrolase YtcJ